MFDIGMTELLLIGIVALIVIGPKDLPEMFRTLGRFTAKARGMAREFSRAMESAADESGVNDVAKDLRAATSAKSMGLDVVKDAARKFEQWDPMKSTKPDSATTLAKPDPAAPAPATPPASPPKGPSTQALADAQTAKRAATLAKAEAAKTISDPTSSAAKTATPKVAAKPPTAKPPTAKPAKSPKKSDA